MQHDPLSVGRRVSLSWCALLALPVTYAEQDVLTACKSDTAM